MSDSEDNKEYLKALSNRVRQILKDSDDDEPIKKEKETPKAKNKKEQTAEQRQIVLERLAKAREKAMIVKREKSEIKKAQLKEKQQEFENLKTKYLKNGKETEKQEEKTKITPKRERAIIPPYVEEKNPEKQEENKEVKIKPIEIQKPEPQPEQEPEKEEIIKQNTPQKPRYFRPTMNFINKYGGLYS